MFQTTNRYIICQFAKAWMAIGGYEDLAGDQQLSQQKHICSMYPQPTPVQVAE